MFGYGLKSFRVKCWQVYSKDERQLILDEGRPKGCSNHPHQYYLHLLVEAGFIGTVFSHALANTLSPSKKKENEENKTFEGKFEEVKDSEKKKK